MNCVFIWVPKTAGTSIHMALSAYNYVLITKKKQIPTFSQRGFVSFGHISYFALLRYGFVSQEFDENSFKFSFVRNPYDRAISLYEYSRAIGRMKEYSFQDCLEHIIENGIRPIGLYNRRDLSQFNNQSCWLFNSKNELIVDFLGRFEKIENDIRQLSKIFGKPFLLHHKYNKTVRKDQSFYYNKKTKALVKQIYAQDLENFGYSYPY